MRNVRTQILGRSDGADGRRVELKGMDKAECRGGSIEMGEEKRGGIADLQIKNIKE